MKSGDNVHPLITVVNCFRRVGIKTPPTNGGSTADRLRA